MTKLQLRKTPAMKPTKQQGMTGNLSLCTSSTYKKFRDKDNVERSQISTYVCNLETCYIYFFDGTTI